MKNLFDSDNYPDDLPSELPSGDRWAWTRSDLTEIYGVTDYDLVYKFTQLEEPHGEFTQTADSGSGAFVFEIHANDSGDYPPGEYSWSAVIKRKSDDAEVTVDRGVVEVSGGVAWTYQVLCKIKATILGTASRDDAAYSIQGRSLSRRSPAELQELHDIYERRWKEQKRKIDNANGRATSNRILARMRG